MSYPYIKNNIVYNIAKNPDESLEHYIMRSNFIASQAPQNPQEFTRCETYSRIYLQNKIYHTEYAPDIMQNLKKMESIILVK
jgi:hypothetical protein